MQRVNNWWFQIHIAVQAVNVATSEQLVTRECLLVSYIVVTHNLLVLITAVKAMLLEIVHFYNTQLGSYVSFRSDCYPTACAGSVFMKLHVWKVWRQRLVRPTVSCVTCTGCFLNCFTHQTLLVFGEYRNTDN